MVRVCYWQKVHKIDTFKIHKIDTLCGPGAKIEGSDTSEISTASQMKLTLTPNPAVLTAQYKILNLKANL